MLGSSDCAADPAYKPRPVRAVILCDMGCNTNQESGLLLVEYCLVDSMRANRRENSLSYFHSSRGSCRDKGTLMRQCSTEPFESPSDVRPQIIVASCE